MNRNPLSVCVLLALAVACGQGSPSGVKSAPDMQKKIFAARSAGLTASQREGIYDHCAYDINLFCPSISPSDKNYFRKAAGCLHDHAQDITDDCSNAFQVICGDTGDDCDFDNDTQGPGYQNADKCKPSENYYNHKCYAACAEGLVFYQGKCLNLKTDPNNCGDINNQCDVEGGDPCYNGECIASCPSDVPQATDCGGTCTDTSSDFYNCGACGHSCGGNVAEGATRSCSRGQCVTSCGGKVCTAPPHGTVACIPLLNAPIGPGETCGFVCDPGYVSHDGKTCVPIIVVTCDPRTEVLKNGHCYYLDGSGGNCDPGYALAPESVLSNGLFAGKTYKHTVSTNCCIQNAGPVENFGMGSNCNEPGLFGPRDPTAGAVGCTAQTNRSPRQLTLCGK